MKRFMKLEKPTKLRLAIVVAVLLLFSCICVFAASQTGQPSPTTAVAQMSNPTSANTVAPTAAASDTPAPTRPPTNTPEPTATLEPEMSLKSSIVEALGNGNRGIPRLTTFQFQDGEIGIKWAIDDGLTENMVKTGAKLDIFNMLEAVSKTSLDYRQVTMIGTFSMQDAFGNASELNVVTVLYLKETVDKINWDNFSFSNVYAIADEAILQPAFK